MRWFREVGTGQTDSDDHRRRCPGFSHMRTAHTWLLRGESWPSRPAAGRWHPRLAGSCQWASETWFPSFLPFRLQSFWLFLWRDSHPLDAPAFAGRTVHRTLTEGLVVLENEPILIDWMEELLVA